MEESIKIILEAVQRAKGELDSTLGQIQKLNSANKQSEGIFARVNRAFKENTKLIRDLKIATGAAAAAVILLGKQALKSTDAMGKQAKQVGLLTSAYSKLVFAAEINEVSQEELFRGLAHFSKALVEAQDPTSKMAKSLDGLGFSAEDVAAGLQKGGLEGAFLKLSKNFSETEGEARKTALAMEFLSRGGKEFVNFLNIGPDAIRKFGDEAKALGAVVTDDLALGSDAVNDNFVRLNFAFQGVRNEVLTALLPALIAFTNLLVEVAKDGTTLKTVAFVVAAGLKTVAQVAIVLVGAFKILGLVIGSRLASSFNVIEAAVKGTVDLFDHLVFNIGKVVRSALGLAESFGVLGPALGKFIKGDLVGAAEASAQGFTTIKTAAARLAVDAGSTFHGLGRDIAITGAQAAQNYLDGLDQINAGVPAIVEETKKLLAAVNSESVSIPGEAPGGKRKIEDPDVAIRARKAAAELSKVTAELSALAIEEANVENDGRVLSFKKAQEQINNIQALSLTLLADERLAALAELDAQEIANDELKAQKKLAIDKDYAVKVKQLEKETQKSKVALNVETLGALGTIFSQSAQVAEAFGKKGFIAAKAFAVASATINTILAVSNALATVPYPLNFVAAGVAAAVGAIQVAQIAGVSFAEGGLVPGAPSSTDNRIANVATGEYIFDAGSVAKAGPGWFAGLHAAIRDGSFFQGFADGGIVPRPVSSSNFATGGLVGETQRMPEGSDSQVNFGFTDTRNQQRDFARKEGVRIMIDMLQKRGSKVFA